MIISLLKMRKEAPMNIEIAPVVRDLILTSVILLADAVVYWILRKRFYRMSLVWIHIILLFVLLVILPVIYVLVVPLLSNYFGADLYYEWLNNFRLVRIILFWMLLIGAHLFFVFTLVKG